MVLEPLSPGRREVVTSGGERDRRQAWTHDITPPLRNGFQTFSSAQQGERQSGGGGVEEEGLETEADTGARVVQVEQEDREQTPPIPQELCVWNLWAPGTERTLERALALERTLAHGMERALERTLWAHKTERALERTLWAHGTERALERTHTRGDTLFLCLPI